MFDPDPVDNIIAEISAAKNAARAVRATYSDLYQREQFKDFPDNALLDGYLKVVEANEEVIATCDAAFMNQIFIAGDSGAWVADLNAITARMNREARRIAQTVEDLQAVEAAAKAVSQFIAAVLPG